MKSYATLPEAVEVKGVALTNSYVTVKSINDNDVRMLVINDNRGLISTGTDEVREGRIEIPYRYVLAKFIAADNRISSYITKLGNANVAAAQVSGTLKVRDENSSVQECVQIAMDEAELRNRATLEAVKAFATIDVTYHKNKKADSATGEIKPYFNIAADDVVVNISDDFKAHLDKVVPSIILL